MSLSHLAEVCGYQPRQRFAGDFSWPPRPLPNPPMPPRGGTGTVFQTPPRPVTVTCDYCGSVIDEGRCPSCGAPWRPRSARVLADRAPEDHPLRELPDPTDWGPLASRSDTPWLLILLVLTALVGVLAGYL